MLNLIQVVLGKGGPWLTTLNYPFVVIGDPASSLGLSVAVHADSTGALPPVNTDTKS